MLPLPRSALRTLALAALSIAALPLATAAELPAVPTSFPTLNFNLVDAATGITRLTYTSLDACMKAGKRLASSEGVATSCSSYATTSGDPAPPWSKIAGENDHFVVASSQLVRYGIGDYWVQQFVSGTVQCSNAYFGVDPAYGIVKECDVNVAVEPPIPDSQFSIPTVNTAAIPLPLPGFSTDRLAATAEIAPDSDIGAFRTTCDFSHMAFDDPIVYPGQPGKSHLHAFFGNTGTNANSTAESLLNSGDSTCRGGTINRTGYWVPAMIDTLDGTPIRPLSLSVYYKTGYNGVRPADVRPFPAGLRMITGDSTATNPYSGSYNCDLQNGNSGNVAGIPDCKPLTGLLMNIDFPQCWDGVNLDSPDHKSHMAFANGQNFVTAAQVAAQGYALQWYQTLTPTAACPPTHPVALPLISMGVWYQTPATAHEVLRWRLASDKYNTNKPGGYSIHADWFNGWKADVMNAWVQGCDQSRKDCHSHLLGDGRMMY